MRSELGELVLSADEWEFGLLCDPMRDLVGEVRIRVQTSAYRRSTEGQLEEVRERMLYLMTSASSMATYALNS